MIIALGLAFAFSVAFLAIHAAVWLGFRARDAFTEWRWRRQRAREEYERRLARAFYLRLRERTEKRQRRDPGKDEPPPTLRSP